MRKFNVLFLMAALSMAAFAVSGCKKKSDGGGAGSTGYIKILATDAPYPSDLIASAEITIDEVSLRKSSGSFVTLSTAPVTIDLVELRNGITDTLASLEIPVGSYDQVRLIISEGSIRLKDGRSFNLKTPSGDSSGYKVGVSPAINVVSRVSSDLLLDFDLARSFVPTGNPNSPNGFNLRPVIRGANLTTAGTIEGVVKGDSGTPANAADDVTLEGVIVTIKDPQGNPIASSLTDSQGRYKILGVTAGDYEGTISFTGYADMTGIALHVVAGNVLELDGTLRLLPVTDPPQ